MKFDDEANALKERAVSIEDVVLEQAVKYF